MPRRLIIVATACLASALPAGAETPLATLNGVWSGRGTDRDMPWHTAQVTRCRTTVKAGPAQLSSDTVCNGEAGLTKRFQLALTLDGAQISGRAEQTSRSRPGGVPVRRAGTVDGERRGDTAALTVHFAGLTPNAHVVLTLISPTSFSMQIASVGSVLTQATFHRPAR